MEKPPLNSFRVAYENWYDEKRFQDILDLFDKHRHSIDQIALFTSATHAPLTIDEMNHRVYILTKRIVTAKEHGYSCGINILATIGHHCEDLKHSLNLPYYRMTNIECEVCEGSFCMNDSNFIEGYVKPVYTLLAYSHPDFIWIDDDVRYSHWPIGNGCFCDNCIDIFNRDNGSKHSRESLKVALDKYDIPFRKQWLRHQGKSISMLFSEIVHSVRAVSNEIILGFMTGERFFEGYDFAEFANALSENGTKNIMWRPGGGTYTDYAFDAFIEKAGTIGRQTAYLPNYVNIIQSELENFPYQLIKKSPLATAIEAAIYLAVGCNGTTFNIFPSETGEPVANTEQYMNEIDRMSGFYRLLSDTFNGSKISGIHTGWCKDSIAAGSNKLSNGWGECYNFYAAEIFNYGLPEAYDLQSSSAFMLTQKSAYALTDAEILHVLSKGVYLDSAAVSALNDLGYGEYIGFTVGEEVPVDAREQYLHHTLNIGIENGIRNCRQAFNQGDSFNLIPVKGAEVLCNLIDYHDNILADCSMGIFKNSLGGTVCAAGYYPFTWISDYYKTIQMKRIFKTLTENNLPVYVDTYCRIHTFAHTLENDRNAFALLNNNIETLENIRICVKTENIELTLTDMTCKSTVLNMCDEKDGYKIFMVPNIKSYGMCLITD